MKKITLTEAQFKNVVEQTVNKLNEEKEMAKIFEYVENPAVGATIAAGGGAALMGLAIKSVYSEYKNVKAQNPQLTAGQAISQALMIVAKSVANAKQ